MTAISPGRRCSGKGRYAEDDEVHDLRPVSTGMGRVELYCRWCGGCFTP